MTRTPIMCLSNSASTLPLIHCYKVHKKKYQKIILDLIDLVASNLLNNNVNAVSLARTHRPMPSSSLEMGQYHPRPSASPPGFGMVLPLSLGTQTALADASEPDSWHSINAMRQL